MGFGVKHPYKLKAEAIAAVALGESCRQVAARLGISHVTVRKWTTDYGPVLREEANEDRAAARAAARVDASQAVPQEAEPTRAEPRAKPSLTKARPLEPRVRSTLELGDLIYDVLVVTLEGLRARAEATSQPEWIQRQTADALARLAEVEWNQLIRVLASIRPTPQGDLGADAQSAFSEPDGAGTPGASQSSNRVEPAARPGTMDSAA
jgi:hypothetical protein